MVTSAWKSMTEEGEISLSGLSSLMMGLTMLIPGFTATLGALGTVTGLTTVAVLANTKATNANAIAKRFSVTVEQAKNAQLLIQKARTNEAAAATLKADLAQEGVNITDSQAILIKMGLTKAILATVGAYAVLALVIVGAVIAIKKMFEAADQL